MFSESLIKWISTINIKCNTLSDMKSHTLFDAIKNIDPNYFSSNLPFKISTDQNYEIETGNLKLFLICIELYISKELGLSYNDKLTSSFYTEQNNDALKMMIVQLILVCAVNCANKYDYVTRILEMESHDQLVLMNAISELEIKEINNVISSNISPSEQGDIVSKIKMANVELEKRCQDYIKMVDVLVEEKRNLENENRKLFRELALSPPSQSDKDEKVVSSDIGQDETTYSTVQYQNLKKQMDNLKQDNLILENAKDDYIIQIDLLRKELHYLNKKNEELTQLSSEATKYKDELDVLRHLAEKIPTYESTIETLKKKLEALSFSKPLHSMASKTDRNELEMDNNNLSEMVEGEKRKFVVIKKELDGLVLKYRELERDREKEREKLELLTVQKVELRETISKLEAKIQNLSSQLKDLKDENDHLNLCLIPNKNALEPTSHYSSSVSVDPQNQLNEKINKDSIPTDVSFKEKEQRYLLMLTKAQKVIELLESNVDSLSKIAIENDKLLGENERLKESQETICLAWNNLTQRMYKQNMQDHFNSNLWSHNSFLNRQRLILASKTMKK